MNEDDLLFGLDDLERLKRRQQVGGWLDQQLGTLLARSNAQAVAISDLRSGMTALEWAKLDAPMDAGRASIIPPPTPLGRAGRTRRPPV